MVLVCIISSSLFAKPYKISNVPQYIIAIEGIILSTILIYLSKKDLREMIIPWNICLKAILIGIFSIFLRALFEADLKYNNLITEHVCSIIFYILMMRSISIFSKTIFKKDMLGFGDASLTGIGAAWLGFQNNFIALSIAFISAGLISLVLRISGRVKPFKQFPFGPYISAGIWGVWLLGPNWWGDRWISLLGL